MNLDDVKLKPCPFCGNEAIIGDKADWNYSVEYGKEFQLGCSNENCREYYIDIEASNKEELKSLIAMWNTRF
jgi:predicted RNA-binding protein associated with RNAse of E/G family